MVPSKNALVEPEEIDVVSVDQAQDESQNDEDADADVRSSAGVEEIKTEKQPVIGTPAVAEPAPQTPPLSTAADIQPEISVEVESHAPAALTETVPEAEVAPKKTKKQKRKSESAVSISESTKAQREVSDGGMGILINGFSMGILITGFSMGYPAVCSFRFNPIALHKMNEQFFFLALLLAPAYRWSRQPPSLSPFCSCRNHISPRRPLMRGYIHRPRRP